MIYQNIKKLIERKSYDENDLIKKINTFYSYNRITTEEYRDLMSMLGISLED